jgi:hypothetical protein
VAKMPPNPRFEGTEIGGSSRVLRRRWGDVLRSVPRPARRAGRAPHAAGPGGIVAAGFHPGGGAWPGGTSRSS